MHRILGALLCLAGSMAAFGSACQTDTLDAYINLGTTGCELGILTFQNFELAPGQAFATPIDPLSVQVIPTGSALAPALLFTTNMNAGPGDLFELIFRFEVAASLVGAGIELNDPSISGEFASVIGVVNVCPGANYLGVTPIGCPTETQLIAALSANGSDLSAHADFPITSFFDVFVDLTVDGVDGTAGLPSATVTINADSGAAPEPSTLVLLLSSLATLYRIRKRKV